MAARGSRISSPVLSLQRSTCALQVLCLCQRPKAHRPCTSCLPLKHVGGCQNVAADSLVATDLQFDHTVSINLTTASTIISIIIFVSAAAIHAGHPTVRTNTAWNTEDFVVLKVDMRNAFNVVSRQAVLMSVVYSFQNCSRGRHGTMVNTQYYGTQWEPLVQKLVCNKETPYAHYYLSSATEGDLIFCAKIVAQKRAIALKLLNQLSEVVPAPVLNFHLDPSEFQAGIKWWLGVMWSPATTGYETYSWSPAGELALVPELKQEVVLGHDQPRTRPADVLVPDWVLGKPAAFDITVTSLLNPSTFTEASVMAGSAALAAEQRKHHANDAKCSELGWNCIPLAVESYGCWGIEARQHLARLASRLATHYNQSKSQATSSLYGRLNLALVKANVRALLSHSMSFQDTY
eukprot:Em0213g5a